jgi:hypothetical protein
MQRPHAAVSHALSRGCRRASTCGASLPTRVLQSDGFCATEVERSKPRCPTLKNGGASTNEKRKRSPATRSDRTNVPLALESSK